MSQRVLLVDPFAKGSCSNLVEADAQRKVLASEPLDETVQQLRVYLDGKHQVLDLGTIGLFRTYLVKEVSEDFVLSVLQYAVPGAKQGTAAAAAWLRQVHSITDYWKSRNADGMDSPFSAVLDIRTIVHIKQNVQSASDAITGLGIPRQRDTLILLDLSARKNSITGGGVGGYAYRRTHAIEADLVEMSKPFGVELLVHEWGHKQFFNLPQHVTKFVHDWFEANVAGHAVVQVEPLLSASSRAHVVASAWSSFRNAWKKWEGIYPEQYAQLKKRAVTTAYGDLAPLLDVFLSPHMSAVGKLTKGVKGEREGDDAPSLRKGARVWVISASAMLKDGYGLIPLKGDTPSGKDVVYVSGATVRASFELDAEASAKKNDVNLSTLLYRLQSLQTHDTSDDRDVDNYFTRESALYTYVDDAVSAATDRLKSKHVTVHTSDVMSSNTRDIVVFKWIEKARREGDKFDPQATFEKLFTDNIDWTFGATHGGGRARLSTPSGADMREALAKLGITPSSYAASNVDELWAELIATAALNPNKVSKDLKALLRDAIQGKTPGPGQRMKVDNTPKQFRKRASESTVLLTTDPFLNEMNKHGNKRSHASRVRAYKKSGKMFGATFSTDAGAARSAEADRLIDWTREGLSAWNANEPDTANPYPAGSEQSKGWSKGYGRGWFGEWRRGKEDRGLNKKLADNPFKKGTNDHRAWLDGWNDEDAHMRDANESTVLLGRSPFVDEAKRAAAPRRQVFVYYKSEKVDSWSDGSEYRDYTAYYSDGTYETWTDTVEHGVSNRNHGLKKRPGLRSIKDPNELAKNLRRLRDQQIELGSVIELDAIASLEERVDESAEVTKAELNALEAQLDKLFASAGIDIEFTKHFLDRTNDARNGKQITVDELRRIFQAVWRQHHEKLKTAEVDWKAVIRDLPTSINIPVVIDYDTRTGAVELVSKTIMRTKRFMAREQQLVVKSESVDEVSAPPFVLHRSHGISREKMPQIKSVDIPKFLDYLRDRGISVTKGERAVGNLKATQDKVDPEKIGVLLKQAKDKLRLPIVISKDLRIMDGHHRWAALMQLGADERIETWEVDLSIRELLRAAKRFDGAFFKDHGESVDEGVDDPHVLKAVFLAGGAGSGKSFIGTQAFNDTGLRVVNADAPFEHLMRKAGIDMKRDVGSEQAQDLRPRAKELAAKRKQLLISGRVGLLIDGTGDDPAKIKRKKDKLEALGYDTSMVFVDVPLETARRRNAERHRVVPDHVLVATHRDSQRAKQTYRAMFGSKFEVVVNDKALSPAEIARDLNPKLARIALRLIGGPVANPVGRAWIRSQIKPTERHRALGKEPALAMAESVVLLDRSPFA